MPNFQDFSVICYENSVSHYPDVFYLNDFSPSNYFSFKVIIFLDALHISFSFIPCGTVPHNRYVIAFCSLT